MPHPRDTWPKPAPERILLAFVAAPASATALFAGVPLIISVAVGNITVPVPVLISQILGGIILGLIFVALPLTVVIGIPLFLVLRRLVRPSFWACSLAGVAVLWLPLLALVLLGLPDVARTPYASSSGHLTILHGQPTIWWWLDWGYGFGVAGVLGLVGGFVFWLVAAAGLKPEKQGAAVVHSGAQPRPEEAESEPVIPENVT